MRQARVLQVQRAKVNFKSQKVKAYNYVSLYVRGVAASLKGVQGKSNICSSCESDL